MKLKLYTVGENDLVAATDADNARAVLFDTIDVPEDEKDEYQSEPLAPRLLKVEVKDEDGNPLGYTFGERLAQCDKPQHLWGWE